MAGFWINFQGRASWIWDSGVFFGCLFCFVFLAALRSLQDLSAPIRDQTWVLAVSNHWTAREFPQLNSLMEYI